MGHRELASVADETAEDGVCDAGHGREDCSRGYANVANGEAGGDAAVLGHRVRGGRVPLLLLEGVALLHLDTDFHVGLCLGKPFLDGHEFLAADQKSLRTKNLLRCICGVKGGSIKNARFERQDSNSANSCFVE